MSTYDALCTSIRTERLRLTSGRQPSIIPGYDQLDAHAITLGIGNIYKRNTALYSDICRGGACYINNPAGPAILPVHENRLYRVATVGSFLNDIDGTIERSNLSLTGHPLSKKFTLPMAWYPIDALLKKGTTANYQNKRGHTWWTPEGIADAIVTNQLSAALTRELGLPDDWVNVHAVILRITEISSKPGVLAHLPTSIEAFLSSIFLPQDEHSAACGTALNVNDVANIQLGRKEVVMGSLSTKVIEFLPLSLHFPESLVVSDDLTLLQSLVTFYQNQP